MRRSLPVRVVTAVAAATMIAAMTAVTAAPLSAQGYSFDGSLEAVGRAGYIRDSDLPATVNPSLRGTWFGSGYSELRGVHRFGGGALLIDHSVIVVPAGVPGITVGPAGQGADGAALAEVDLELYLFAFQHDVGPLSILAGRHFDARRQHQVADASRLQLLFPVVDVVHPRETDPVRAAGLDGLSLVLSSADQLVQGQFTVAAQDVQRGNGEFERLRFAGSFLLGSSGVTLAWQQERILRPGAFVQIDVPGARILLEGAVELYNARSRVVKGQPLGGVRVEAGGGGPTGFSGALEYHFNGVASSYPEPQAALFTSENRVTLDGAGGFLLPGYRYLYAGAGYAGGRAGNGGPTWRTTHGVTLNLSDRSGRVEHSLGVDPAGPLSFAADLTWNTGGIFTEFGRDPLGMLLTLRAGVSLGDRPTSTELPLR